MHKNNEGYADPTAGKAINGVRQEEYQKYLEELHGIKAWANCHAYPFHRRESTTGDTTQVQIPCSGIT